jgi:Zn-dependent protease
LIGAMPLHPLADVDLTAPMTWAIVIGWIMSVVLHEFAHGLVAYLGGDYTIRERGGLTLNPFHYIDPLNSIILPVVFLMMGGIPLPGGATFIRTRLLKSRWWESAVAAAGPATNFILFLVCALPFHPRVGWIDTTIPPDQYAPWQIFLGGMAQLQMIAVVLNLVPVPPLDGFNIIGPLIPEETRLKLSTPPVSTMAFLAFFFIVWSSPKVIGVIYLLTHHILVGFHFDPWSREALRRCFNFALFGRSD